ncbi:hypothetical protein TSAR_006910 [Trichomalopsis sarcophagae]|uniref:Uncharacterized protein n=1 Tax=Trichomalopsis sarcophagae TaxID=543379 RepID=A0A232EFK8_9HYME|nr:hypothetical protein TSAR_006910 [Trichomalopsis sarcophagae]
MRSRCGPHRSAVPEVRPTSPLKLKNHIHVQWPEKSLSNETTLILSTLDTKYLQERSLHNIRVLRPRKPPNKKFRQNMLLIFRQTRGDDVNTGHPGHQVPWRPLLMPY